MQLCIFMHKIYRQAKANYCLRLMIVGTTTFSIWLRKQGAGFACVAGRIYCPVWFSSDKNWSKL